MPTVYVVNRGGHDYSEATKYGHIVFLSEGPLNKYAVSQIYRKFAMQLRTSSPDDFILLTGLTGMACIACSCFAFLHGKLNMLLFKNGRYIDRKLNLSELLAKGGAPQADQLAEITDFTLRKLTRKEET